MLGERRTLRSIDESRSISHIGVLERSGRYPWGSGENPYQRLRDWQGYVRQLRKGGMTDAEIAKACGMTDQEFKDSLISSTQRRQQTTIKNAQQRVTDVARAWELKNKGYSNVVIAESMGVTEGTIRNLLKPGADEKARQIVAVSDSIKAAVDGKGPIDVGADVNRYLGISKTKMDACVALLKEEGYNIYYTKVKQLGTNQYTTIKALCPPGMDYKTFIEQYNADPSIVKPLGFYAEERNGDPVPVTKPVSIDRDRILVRFGDEAGPDGATGSDRDGVIQLRPGVEDLDLLGSKYAQVRIAVNDTMYMKGMAVYGDPKDFPDGVDVIYNSNRPTGSPDLTEGVKEGVFKKMYKKGEDDPFGASTSLKMIDEETGDIIYQKTYISSNGQQHQSALNIVNDQGAWQEWAPSLASQMLSKQSPELAKQQLGIVSQSKQDELDEILSLNNPTVQKKMLEEYADSCDSAAVHLKAAALPRQQTQVLIPIPSLSDSECYAPNFRDGETVVLIRYPHAGTFEIPELSVNNKNKEGQAVIGKAEPGLDAIGINKNVADKLSGADFDGDTAIVIPNNDGKIKTSEMLSDLRNFDPKISYKLAEDSPELSRSDKLRERDKQKQMGVASNLITDMTIKGDFTQAELARAVKYSMVVIDSVKHNLDWKQAEKDLGIQELKNKYQPKEDPDKPGGGASTLISKASGEVRIPEQKMVYSTKQMTDEQEKEYYSLLKSDPEKAAKIPGLTAAEKKAYDAGEVITRATGRYKLVQEGDAWVKSDKLALQKVSGMASVKDARELSSGTVIEEVYAAHANTLKSLANQARAAARSLTPTPISPSAKKVYAEEVASLDAKLDTAKKNAPVERQAQLVANASVKAKIASNPEIASDKDAIKKAKNKALEAARIAVGANKKEVQVEITDKEWEAIQAGAVSSSKLMEILNNTDMDAVKKRATPRASTGLSDAQIARAKQMAKNGLSQADIADALGVSTGTISAALKT